MLSTFAMVTILHASATAQAPSPCPTPVAPDAQAARKVAHAAIEEALEKGAGHRELIVEPDRDRPGSWIAYQATSDRAFGGGGLHMRIDHCPGSVSALHRQR
ncbi:MAG: hypothetical protein ABW164_07160 [Sphingobium sp.]